MALDGTTGELVYLNGKFVRFDEAKVSVWDRGFLFADAVYEVIRCYSGTPFRLEDHLERLFTGLRGLELDEGVSEGELAGAIFKLAKREAERLGRDILIYIQVTRGAAPRTHAFPVQTKPTVVMFVQAIQQMPNATRERGVRVVTADDNRWGLCHIKGTGLLPNVLAKEKAKRQGAFEAIFIRDGVVTEGSSSNVFAVIEGELLTHPLDGILPGITRKTVIQLAREMSIPVVERAMRLEEVLKADEAFLTSSTIEIMPVAEIDGVPVGFGGPGPVTRSLYERFQDAVRLAVSTSKGEAICAGMKLGRYA